MRGSYFRALARLVVGLGISGALGIFGNIGTASAQAQTCVKYWTTFQTTSIPQSPDFDSYGEVASWLLGQYNAHSANSTWELARWSTVEPTGFAIAEYLKPTHSYNGYLNIAIWTRPCPFTISLAGAGSTHAMKAGPVVDMMAIVSGGAPEGTAVSISLNGSAALSGATNANGAYKFKYVPPETASSARLTATCTGCTNTASHGITVYGARLPDMCPRDPGSLLGNPIAAASGEKIQTEQDWQDASAHPLNITRGYRSYGNVDAGMGPNWSHNYLASLVNEASGGRAVRLGEGTTIVFSRGPTGAWIADNGKDGLIDATGAVTYVRASDESRWLFDASGRLLSITQRNGWAMTMAYTGLQLTTVTNAFGRTLRFIYDGSGKLVSIAPSGAAAVSYGYDTAGRHARVTYQDGATRGYVYEDSRWPNALTGIVDEAGQRYATFSYDVAGRATGTSHALGAQYFAMSYDTAQGGPPGGSLTSATTIDPAIYRGTTQATNPLGQLQTYTYQGGDGTLRLLSAPGPFGGTWFNLRTLTGDNLPASETDFLGITTNYTWDAARRLKLSTTKAAGRPETQTDSTQWHPIFRLPVLVTQAGRRTAYTYDGAGNKLGETVTDTASGQTRATQWTYTPGGLIDTMTDAGGGVWRYSYDAQGNRTAVKNPLNQQVSYVYDAAGRVTQETAPNGLVTTYVWDVRGRLLSRSVGGETSTYAYNTRGLLASAGLPNGHVVTYGYDAAQRLIGATDNRGNSVAYTLDAAGNRIREEVKDARGTIAQVTGRLVDSFNRLVAVQGASGQTSQIAYDANGEPVSQTDPLNQTTARTLDALRRPVATAFADRTSTRQAWDALDQLTQVTDPKGVATRYGHNAFGDVVSETSPDIGTILYARNATGDVIATRDARGQITSITRDILGRPTEIRYADNQASFLAYNADGRLVRIDDESGVTTFERDPQGRVITRSQGVSEKRGVSPSFKAGYTYENGDLSRVNYPSGLSVTYRRTNGLITGIDLLEPGNLKVLRPPVPFIKDLAWTALGQPKSWTWRNGDAAERRHDADGRMTSNELASYTYDAASRITGITQNLYAQVQGKPVTVTPLAFTAAYDARNRLTSFVRDGSETTYTYDANSNRLTAIDKVTSDTDLENAFTAVDLASTTSQALNIDAGSNRLLGLQLTVVGTSKGVVKSTVVTPVNYTLDENGAMTSDGLRTFEYDAAQRLSRVKVFRSGEAASVNYQYNALGQRVFKGEYTAEQTLPSKANLGSGFVNWLKNNFGWLYAAAKKDASLGTAYVYGDEGTEIPAWALLGEYDNGRASGTGRSEYIWLPVAGGNAIPVGMYRNGQLYAIHSDHLGTPRLMTDDAKAVVWQWPYSAFGNNQPTGILKATAKPKGAATQQPMLYEATAPVELNLRMPGQYFDFETGEFYNYFRQYDPRTGRYTQADPLGIEDGSNRFGYVRNTPLLSLDPTGLAVKCRTVFSIPLVADVEECTEDGSNPSEQAARDAKRMSDRELDKACRANGYDDAHAMKKNMGLDSRSDIFADKNGNMYSGPRKGTGTPNYLHMNTRGIIPR